MMLTAEIAAALSDDVATLALLQEREATPPLLAELKRIRFPENLGMVPRDKRSREVFDFMREVVLAMPEVAGVSLLDTLAADFSAIYLTGALDASPSESFWLSDDHLVCQDAMFDMREIYAADGLAVPDWRMRPDDHLVFQLQFVARRLAGISSDQQWLSLACLLDHHLLRWLPDFTRRVSVRCDTPFYSALVLLTDVWCQQLRDLIALHLGEARPSSEELEEILRPQRNQEIVAQPIHFMPGIGGPSW
jgi:TorA maturation chaperone TorD